MYVCTFISVHVCGIIIITNMDYTCIIHVRGLREGGEVYNLGNQCSYCLLALSILQVNKSL